jgi:diaminopimelate decarboxylase
MSKELNFVTKNKSKWDFETPCFVINKSQLTDTIEEIKHLLPGEILYSHKTNPDHAITEAVMNAGFGFLLSSIEETETLITDYKIPPERLVFQTPSLTPQEYDYIKKIGIFRFIIDSVSQLEMILASLDDVVRTPEILIRINTGVKVFHSELQYSTDSFLGFPMEDAMPILERVNELRKNGKITLGLHNHLLSQNTHLEIWEENLETIADFVEKLKSKGIELDKVDFGGGYPIEYNEPCPSLEAISKLIIKATNRMRLAYPAIAFMFEPGRKVVGESITLIGQVAHVKEFRGSHVAILDCSVYNACLDTIIVDLELKTNKTGDENSNKKEYIIRGCTPDSMDIFSKKVNLPELASGDFLAFMHAGAYSFWSDFISLKKPPHILI